MPRVNRNNKAYDSADVRVVILGEVFDEVKEITYGTEQEHQVNHSLSEDATSWSKGKKTHTTSISLYMSDIVKLEKRYGRDLLAIRPFDIQVTFVNEDNEIINDSITAKFKSQGREVNGDMGLSKQFDLLCLDIQYQTQ